MGARPWLAKWVKPAKYYIRNEGRMSIPRTHDLAYLLSGLSEYYELSEPLTEAVLLLSEITPAIRYPADDLPPVDLQLAREYQAACRIIYNWAHSALSPGNKR